MRNRSWIPPFLAAAILGFGLTACAPPGGEDGNAEVSVLIQGATTADNVLAVTLWADPASGTQYVFNLTGTANIVDADFVLEILLDGSPVYSVNFTLPIEDTDAQPGETGSGTKTQVIYWGDNMVPIDFEWYGGYQADGNAVIDINFVHPPRIVTWSAVPGPGAPANSFVDLIAEVKFFGTDPLVDPYVEAEFFDDVGPDPIGEAIILSFTDPLWEGSIRAPAGATDLRLSATDEDGTAMSWLHFPVTP